MNLSDTFQSAYKQYHSTETALIRVHNDILTAIDNRRTVILLPLDLSAAFRLISHTKASWEICSMLPQDIFLILNSF